MAACKAQIGSISDTMTRQPAWRDLAGHHDVGAAADAVDERFAAAIEVVEFRFGYAVIDVDGGPQQRTPFLHLVKPMYAGRCFLRDAADCVRVPAIPARMIAQPLPYGGEENFLFLVGGLADRPDVALLGPQAEMDQQRRVAAVVENHVRGTAVRPLKDAMGVVPVVGKTLAFDGEHRDAARRDGCSCMVLGRIDIAGGPAHVGAERRERLDQHRSLDRHVQGSGDAGAAQRLLRAEFVSRRHQARHFGLRNRNLLAAPFGKTDVLHDVVVRGRHGFRGFRRGGHGHPLIADGGRRSVRCL
jgi:hypothetical protein